MEKTNTFMTVVDVMEYLEVSESKAYRIIRLLNKELKDKGYIVIPGRVRVLYSRPAKSARIR